MTAEHPEQEKPLAPFDFTTILENLDGDVELLQELVSLFIEDAPNHLTALESGLRSNSNTDIQHHAHTLRGASSNVGAEQVRRMAHQLEGMGRNGDLTGAENLLTSLTEHFEAVKEFARTFNWSTLRD